MAVVDPTVDNTNSGYALVSWDNLANGDTATAASVNPSASDKTIQVVGTFGGATIALEGSLDGTNFFPITDASGSAISFTAAGGEILVENCLHYRVVVTGGAGTDVSVKILAGG